MQSSPKQLQDIIHILDGFEGHAATIHRFSAEHLRDMGGYWSALKSLEIDPQIHALWLNITRQRVMISKTWVIRFLYEDCKTLVKGLSARHRAHIFRYDGHMSCDCIQSWETEHGDISCQITLFFVGVQGVMVRVSSKKKFCDEWRCGMDVGALRDACCIATHHKIPTGVQLLSPQQTEFESKSSQSFVINV